MNFLRYLKMFDILEVYYLDAIINKNPVCSSTPQQSFGWGSVSMTVLQSPKCWIGWWFQKVTFPWILMAWNLRNIIVKIYSTTIFCVLAMSTAAEVCFDELGCFNDLRPWGGTLQRPVPVLPWHPEEIGTRFLLFTQKNRYYQARHYIIIFFSFLKCF